MQNKCITLADNVEQDYLKSLEISKVEIKKGNLQPMVRLKLQSVLCIWASRWFKLWSNPAAFRFWPQVTRLNKQKLYLRAKANTTGPGGANTVTARAKLELRTEVRPLWDGQQAAHGTLDYLLISAFVITEGFLGMSERVEKSRHDQKGLLKCFSLLDL